MKRLVLAATLALTLALAPYVPPHPAAAQMEDVALVADAEYGSLCDTFGPLHQYLYYQSGNPDPAWADAIICRESGWNQYAKNPHSTAAGLAQFLDSTWYYGETRFGIWGSPYNGYTAIDMMTAFMLAGEYGHWACTYESGCLR